MIIRVIVDGLIVLMMVFAIKAGRDLWQRRIYGAFGVSILELLLLAAILVWSWFI